MSNRKELELDKHKMVQTLLEKVNEIIERLEEMKQVKDNTKTKGKK